MKNVISLLVITLLLSLSTVSALDMSTNSSEDFDTSATTSDTNSSEDFDTSTTTSDTNSDGYGYNDANTEKYGYNETSKAESERSIPVKDTQKEFIKKYKELKEKYKDEMTTVESRWEFLKERNALFAEYKAKLSEAAKMKKWEMEAKAKEMRKWFEAKGKEMEAKAKEMRKWFEAKRNEITDRIKVKRLKYKERRSQLRSKFKEAISKNQKIRSKINVIKTDWLKRLLTLIDSLVLKTEWNTKLSDEVINTRTSTYNALRDIITDKLASESK